MSNTIVINVRRSARVVGVLGIAVVLAGCGLSGLGGQSGVPPAVPPVILTEHVLPSVVVAVLNGSASDLALSGLVGGTARPEEDLMVLQAYAPSRPILSSEAPIPATVVIPGRPRPPGSGETSYQWAQYEGRLRHWRGELATGNQEVYRKTRDALSAWLGGLGLAEKTSRLADPPGAEGSLAAESADAASALAGLDQGAGNVFGGRRVIVLYCSNLSGVLPAGELSGDDVIVITPFLPSVADVSAAQAELLSAGAAQAAVLGPEVTAAQLATLVSADLSPRAMVESLSTPVLFANDSATLLPSAVNELTKLLPQLLAAGVTAVINGYASTPGTADINYTLSYERAAAVASFLESHGVPASSLIIVGHGASDLVAPGSSGLNRRVIVVIERA